MARKTNAELEKENDDLKWQVETLKTQLDGEETEKRRAFAENGRLKDSEYARGLMVGDLCDLIKSYYGGK